MKTLKLSKTIIFIILFILNINFIFSKPYKLNGFLVNKIDSSNTNNLYLKYIEVEVEVDSLEFDSFGIYVYVSKEEALKYNLTYNGSEMNKLDKNINLENKAFFGISVFYLYQMPLKINYTENKWQTQPIATIFKYRFGNWFDKPVIIENGGSFAIAVNYTTSDYNYDPKNQIFNKGFNYSFGLLLGLGVTDVNSKNSRVASDVSTKIVTISPGLIASLGYDRFSVGFVIGLDLGIGPNTTKWNYNGFPWAGFTFGLDIIK